MGEQQTCGKGLAEHSVLPARLAELIGAMARNLELHQGTLDLSDKRSRTEHDVYVTLATELREIAERLEAIATTMAGYHDLPMGRHDQRAWEDPKFAQAFATYVEKEQELRVLLEHWVERDQAMLAAMRKS